MKKDTAAFVPTDCLPPGTVLHDPRNMALDNIRKVLQHCYTRQTESDPKSAFRFRIFIGPKRKHVPVNSPGSNGDESGEQINSRKERRKKKGRGKQRADSLDGLLQIDPILALPTGANRPIASTSDRISNPQLVTQHV
jgi:hypothetical protein